MALEKEIQTYRSELPKLLDRSGKYVLIKGDNVIDTFDTYEDALKQGYKIAGLDPFLVKQIQYSEQVQYMSRELVA